MTRDTRSTSSDGLYSENSLWSTCDFECGFGTKGTRAYEGLPNVGWECGGLGFVGFFIWNVESKSIWDIF